METLLINKNNVPYAATVAAGTTDSLTLASEIDVLKEGSLVAFEKNGTKVTSGGSFTKTDTKGYFWLGMPNSIATRKSPLINWDTLKYNKNVYTAAVAQVGVLGGDGVTARTTGAFAAGDVGTEFVCTVASTAGDFRATTVALLKVVSTGVSLDADTDLVAGEKYEVIAAGTPDAWGGATLVSSTAGVLVTGTKVVGAEYGVTIHDLSKEVWERNKWDVTLTLTSATTTDAQMLTALAAAINTHAQASLVVTAAVLDTDKGIKFTGVNAGESFKVYPQGLLYGTTFFADNSGITVAPIIGEGTNEQIMKLELATKSVEGYTGTQIHDEIGQNYPIYNIPSLVEVGVNYTVYVLEWTDQREVAYPSNNANPNHKRLNIAIPSSFSAMITIMDNVLADLIA